MILADSDQILTELLLDKLWKAGIVAVVVIVAVIAMVIIWRRTPPG